MAKDKIAACLKWKYNEEVAEKFKELISDQEYEDEGIIDKLNEDKDGARIIEDS